MPSYYYHLIFELYPTPSPTRDELPPSPPSTIWLPTKGSSIFDSLPSHPHRPRKASQTTPDYRGDHTERETPIPGSREPSRRLIDCGASTSTVKANEKKFAIISERQWRARTKSFPPPRSFAAIRPQTAVHDWRFGAVSIESIDDDMVREDKEKATGEPASSGAPASLDLGPTLGGIGSATKAKFISGETKNTELGWGVVHFYREGDETPTLDLPPGEDGPSDEETCTTLCIPAVPSYISPSDFLGFVGQRWRTDVTHFRMVMTAQMSRYLVLLKFRDSSKARQWRREFNGKVFNELGSQICHVVFVKSITFETPTVPKESSPEQSSSVAALSSLKPFPPPTPKLIELPTCPVCLERMDDTNGLMTIPCQHVFHCTCLLNWFGSGCPVCRYTSPSHSDPVNPDAQAFGSQISNLCSVCDCTSDLWVCLICGKVGCGRYKGGHAKDHWKETAHSFALEIETQHVWDYADDKWVHRLIRDKGDGKVTELPGSSRRGGHEREDEDVVPRAKLETMGLEYTHLLTSQLESQRAYFENIIRQVTDKAAKASAATEKATAQYNTIVTRLQTLEEDHARLKDDTIPELERDLEREKIRANKAQDLSRKLTKAVQEEKQLTQGLMARVEHLTLGDETWKTQNETLKKEKAELEEMNRDLTMFISGQQKLKELEDEGKVDAEELAEGSVSVPEKPGKRKGKK